MSEPMLAARGEVEDIPQLEAQGYIFDLKIDGVRCVADIVDGQVHLTSRRHVSLNKRFPEVVDLLAATYPIGSWTFDGELAVNDERGLPNWPLTHRRATRADRSTANRAHFYVFDFLRHGGADLRHLAFANRRQALLSEWERWPEGLRVVLNSTHGQALWDVVCANDLEGLIAKRPAAPYRAGRSADWLKIKRTQTITCMVGGFDEGEGSRSSTFGALHLFLVEDGDLRAVGKVGSGFSDAELRKVAARLQAGSPFAVEVRFLDVSPDGQLRQPVFLRLRDDASISDCTTDQLGGT